MAASLGVKDGIPSSGVHNCRKAEVEEWICGGGGFRIHSVGHSCGHWEGRGVLPPEIEAWLGAGRTHMCVVKGRRRSRADVQGLVLGKPVEESRQPGEWCPEGRWWGTCLQAWDLGELDGVLAASLRALGQVPSP